MWRFRVVTQSKNASCAHKPESEASATHAPICINCSHSDISVLKELKAVWNIKQSLSRCLENTVLESFQIMLSLGMIISWLLLTTTGMDTKQGFVCFSIVGVLFFHLKDKEWAHLDLDVFYRKANSLDKFSWFLSYLK